MIDSTRPSRASALALSAGRQLNRNRADAPQPAAGHRLTIHDFAQSPLRGGASCAPRLAPGAHGAVAHAMARQYGASPTQLHEHLQSASFSTLAPANAGADSGLPHGHGAPGESGRYHRAALVCSIDKTLAMCTQLNDSLPADEQISTDALLVKLIARCLTLHPTLNAIDSRRGTEPGTTTNRALALSTGEHSQIAVLDDAERLGVVAIARRIRAQRNGGEAQGPNLDASTSVQAVFRVFDLRMPAPGAPAVSARAAHGASLTIASAAGPTRLPGAHPEAAEPIVTLTVCVDSRIADAAVCTAFVEDLAAMFAEPRRALL